MPPKAAKGAAATPLDKRLAASTGKEEMSHWNISELKQNLQEDSAVLEQTLREANKLLGETAGVPIVDIKGQVSKDAQLKKLKELLPAEAAELAADGEAAAAPDSTGASTGTGGAGQTNVSSGIFMTELDVSSSSSAPTLVGPVQTRMSEELALRLSVLEDAIGREAAQLLKLTIQSDLNQVCQLARKDEAAKSAKKGGGGGGGGGGVGAKTVRGVDVDEMEAQLLEEEALKLAAQEQVTMLKENLRMQSARLAELQAKVALLDTSSQEGGELLRKREAETKGLRDELLAAQHKTRVEEGERHKLVDKLRKKEVEMGKSKESMDKMTMQLQRLGEERDKMHLVLEETRSKHVETQQRASALQAQLDKLQSAERVLKRNMQLQMPEETKKVVARIEHLEKINKDLSEKLRLLKDTEGAELEKKRIKSELTDLRVHNKALTAKVDELRKDKDLTERAAEGQRRLLENRTRILLDKNTKSTQKLQGETQLRIAERLHNRSADNEVASLRKRNLDVLTKLNVLEEQRMQEQQQLRDSQRRCSELSEKLELYATVHRIDIARLQFSPDVRAELAAEQKRLRSSPTLRLRRSTAVSRASTPGIPDGRISAPPDLGGGGEGGGEDSSARASRPPTGRQAPSQTPDVLTIGSRSSARAPDDAGPSLAATRRPASSGSGVSPAHGLPLPGISPAANDGARASVRLIGGGDAAGGSSESVEALRQKNALLQSKLNSEVSCPRPSVCAAGTSLGGERLVGVAPPAPLAPPPASKALLAPLQPDSCALCAQCFAVDVHMVDGVYAGGADTRWLLDAGWGMCGRRGRGLRRTTSASPWQSSCWKRRLRFRRCRPMPTTTRPTGGATRRASGCASSRHRCKTSCRLPLPPRLPPAALAAVPLVAVVSVDGWCAPSCATLVRPLAGRGGGARGGGEDALPGKGRPLNRKWHLFVLEHPAAFSLAFPRPASAHRLAACGYTREVLLADGMAGGWGGARCSCLLGAGHVANHQDARDRDGQGPGGDQAQPKGGGEPHQGAQDL